MIQAIQQGTIGYRLAIPTLLLLPLAIAGHRSGWLSFQLVTALLALGILTSLALLIGGSIAYAKHRDRAFRDNVRTSLILASIMPLLLLATLLRFALDGAKPIIHDITTDTVDVPQFKIAGTLRGESSNSLAIQRHAIAEQATAYPHIQTLHSEMPVSDALAQAETVAEQLGWIIYYRDPAGGAIEAYDKTPLWGFIDDIVIRVSSKGHGSHIDLRSVSRVGQGDLGANAARITRFFSAFNSHAAAESVAATTEKH